MPNGPWTSCIVRARPSRCYQVNTGHSRVAGHPERGAIHRTTDDGHDGRPANGGRSTGQQGGKTVTATPLGIVLGAGEGRTHTLMGNRITLKVVGAQTAGTVEVLEYEMAPGFQGPAPHVHARTDETFYVLEGEVSFWVDGREVVAGPGACVYVPRGLPHTFSSHEGSGARFLEVVTPGHFSGYFEELAALPATGGAPHTPGLRALWGKDDIIPV